MHWYWNDSPQPLASVYLGHWRKNGIRITQKRLIIERFTEKNDGLYTCMVQRQHVRWKASDNVYLKAKQGEFFLKKQGFFCRRLCYGTKIILQIKSEVVFID